MDFESNCYHNKTPLEEGEDSTQEKIAFEKENSNKDGRKDNFSNL